jgi:hypothetical protein
MRIPRPVIEHPTDIEWDLHPYAVPSSAANSKWWRSGTVDEEDEDLKNGGTRNHACMTEPHCMHALVRWLRVRADWVSWGVLQVAYRLSSNAILSGCVCCEAQYRKSRTTKVRRERRGWRVCGVSRFQPQARMGAPSRGAYLANFFFSFF